MKQGLILCAIFSAGIIFGYVLAAIDRARTIKNQEKIITKLQRQYALYKAKADGWRERSIRIGNGKPSDFSVMMEKRSQNGR